MDYLQLGGQRRGFTLRTSISSSITHRYVVFVFYLSSLNLCHLISAVVVVLFGLYFFVNSMFSLCSYSTHTLFDNKFELVIYNLGV